MCKVFTHWTYGFISLLTLAFAGANPAIASNQTRPNFVVIVLDDWGWHESGAYGNSTIQTPNIDHLAKEGARFNNAFLTMSLCSPSRASILTGLHPYTTGSPKLHGTLPASTKLVNSYLRQAGYFTASVGKWHNGYEVINQFDLFVPEQLIGKDEQTGMEDWLTTIDRLPHQKPFFLWLAAKDAHKPWYHDPRWSIHKPEKMQIPAFVEFNTNHPPEVVRQEMAMYYDEIHRADFYIGEVVSKLRKKQMIDNTVIILMSDNGSPFWKAKKFLTDPGLKTPFIIYWPKQIHQHREINGLLSAVDIAPTLLDLAGIRIPEQMEGASFAHWLKNNASSNKHEIQEIHQFVYGERADGLLGSEQGRSIRDKKYLYIFDDYDTYTRCDDKTKLDYFHGEQLYDVVNDPDNLHNLAAQQNRLQKTWRLITGQIDYTPTVLHYRQLLLDRRRQRNDLPKPIIEGECPLLWWPDASGNPDSKNIPLPKDD